MGSKPRWGALLLASCLVATAESSGEVVDLLPDPPPAVELLSAAAPRPIPELLLARTESPTGRLRGDYDAFDQLLIVYTVGWTDAIAELVAAVPGGARAIVLADAKEAPSVTVWLAGLGLDADRVSVQIVDLDSPWVRDFAPLQLVGSDGSVTWLDTIYRGERTSDDALPELMAERFGVEIERVPFPLDGGALISNGEGLCASTREALVESGVDLAEVDAASWLVGDLGCAALALMPALSEEPTKHADVIAQFLDAETVVVGAMDAESNPIDAARLDGAVAALERAADALGQTLHVVRTPIERGEGTVYYSWVNGLRLGDRYAVPRYEGVDPSIERLAYDRLTGALGDEVELLPIAADPMIHLGGALHCITAELSLSTGSELARHRQLRRTRPR